MEFKIGNTIASRQTKSENKGKGGHIIVSNLKKQHPRLFINSFDEFRQKIDTDARARNWYKIIRDQADGFKDKPYVRYISATEEKILGEMLMASARPYYERVYTLALVYKMEGDKKYFNRLWSEVEHVANFPDWGPQAYLTVAEFLHGMAIAYDWLFYDWSDDQRDIIFQSIKRNGLNVALNWFGGNFTGFDWTTTDSNWAFVCNGGNTLAALAVADEDPEIAEFIIDKSIETVRKALPPYGPDGGFREGSNYWGYATTYLVYYMASLESAVKDGFKLPQSYDLSSWPGVSETAEFAIYITGPTGAFNYGDSIPVKIGSSAIFWLANKFKKPSYAYYQAQNTDNYAKLSYPQPLVVDLMWYDPNNCYLDGDFPLDRKFVNTNDILLRSSFDDDALFVGMKGGYNLVPHGFLSIGSFVLDALGERWANGSVMGNYSWPGYFGTTDRYLYYTAKAQGNNTLVFNPSNDFDQNILGTALIKRFDSVKTNSYGIIDMSEAYYGHVKTIERGVKIFDNRSRVIIQDEVISDKYNEVWWFMHTLASPTFSDDGKRVLLTLNNKQMVVKIASPKEANFMLMDAKLLPEAPILTDQANTVGAKLAIKMENVKDFTLTVEFEPVKPGNKPNFMPADVIPLKDWKAIETEEKSEELIHQKSNIAYGNYSLNYGGNLKRLKVSIGTKKEIERNYVKVKNVIVSASENPGVTGENMIDGIANTRWSISGNHWAMFEFERPTDIYAMGVSVYLGNLRPQYFSLETSTDGESWNEFWSGASSGTTLLPEIYEVNTKSVKFIRLNCFGNSNTTMNGFVEVCFYKDSLQLKDDKSTWKEHFDSANTTNVFTVGERIPVFVTGILENGENIELPTQNINFSISDSKVALISDKGVITTKAKGNFYICAMVKIGNVLRIQREFVLVK